MVARRIVVLAWVTLAGGCAASTSASVEALDTTATTTTTHTPRSPEQTEVSLEACNGGTLGGCHAAALDAYYSPPSFDSNSRALALFKKGCDGGYAASCNGLGVLYKEGRGVQRDLGIAAHLFRRACAADSSTGCQHLAHALRGGHGVPKDADAAGRADARAKCLFEASLAKDARACPAVERESAGKAR